MDTLKHSLGGKILLRTADYEKVLELATIIETNYRNYCHHVLHSIRKVLGFHYVSLFLKNSSSLSSSIFYMNDSNIEEKKRKFSDSIFQNNGNSFDDKFHSTDEFMQTLPHECKEDYLYFLNKNKLTHHIFLLLKTEKEVFGILGIHKTIKNVNFSLREKQICSYVSKFITSNITKHFQIEQLKYTNLLLQDEQKENHLIKNCLKLGLSKRESEIIELISKGNSNQDIAEKLFLSVNTVKTHVNNIFNKLGVNNRMSVINKVNSLISEP